MNLRHSAAEPSRPLPCAQLHAVEDADEAQGSALHDGAAAAAVAAAAAAAAAAVAMVDRYGAPDMTGPVPVAVSEQPRTSPPLPLVTVEAATTEASMRSVPRCIGSNDSELRAPELSATVAAVGSSAWRDDPAQHASNHRQLPSIAPVEALSTPPSIPLAPAPASDAADAKDAAACIASEQCAAAPAGSRSGISPASDGGGRHSDGAADSDDAIADMSCASCWRRTPLGRMLRTQVHPHPPVLKAT